jgi:hypothetical protein
MQIVLQLSAVSSVDHQRDQQEAGKVGSFIFWEASLCAELAKGIPVIGVPAFIEVLALSFGVASVIEQYACALSFWPELEPHD